VEPIEICGGRLGRPGAWQEWDVSRADMYAVCSMQYAACKVRHGESCTVNPTGKTIGTRREDGEHGSNTGDRGVKIAGSDQRIALRDKRVLGILKGKESLDQLRLHLVRADLPDAPKARGEGWTCFQGQIPRYLSRRHPRHAELWSIVLRKGIIIIIIALLARIASTQMGKQ